MVQATRFIHILIIKCPFYSVELHLHTALLSQSKWCKLLFISTMLYVQDLCMQAFRVKGDEPGSSRPDSSQRF